MAYLWTTIKCLLAALLLSYAYWVYTEDAWPYWFYTSGLISRVPFSTRSPPIQTREDNSASDIDIVCSPIETPSRSRFDFGLGPGGTTVYGWPKKGGVYVLNGCGGIDLEFLGFDRLGEGTDLENETRSNSEEEEEAHCNKSEKYPQKNTWLFLMLTIDEFAVRQLGATWWKSRDAHLIASISFCEKSDDVLYVGWPTSGNGAWVLSLKKKQAYDLGKPFGLIHNARDMEERCRMIERFGGKFYEDPWECPYLDLANDTSSQRRGLSALEDEDAQTQI